jgi:SSS family solute:Na+ symporter
MNTTLVGIFVYLGIQLLIGFYVSRTITSESDYLLAGRSFGYGLGIFSIFATWFGAETCIGAAAAVYDEGLSGATADPFGYGLCIVLMGLVFAIPLWKRNLTTLADLFRLRFSGPTEKVAVLLMVPTSLMWAAAQVQAFGHVLASASSLTFEQATSIAACIVILYTVSGGLLADAMTDVVQGVILIIGLALLAWFVVSANGGLGAVAETLGSTNLSFVPSGKTSILTVIDTWAVPICGSVVAQELISRVLAIRSPIIARRSCLIAASVYMLIGLIPVGIGLLGATLFPGLENSEEILPMMASEFLHPFAYTIFIGALLSAILSTVDSALLVSSSLVTHNVIIPLRPGMSERWKLLSSRIGVGVAGLIAWALAMSGGTVYELVEQASAFGSSGIFVCVVFGLFTKIGGARSALASMVVGTGAWILANDIYALDFPYLVSLGAAALAYVVLHPWGDGSAIPHPDAVRG